MSHNGRHLFTSESVTEGHPDKIADQISDSVLDAILAEDPNGRVACETLVTTGLAILAGEVTTTCYVDFQKIVRDTIRDVGYTRAKFGFDHETCAVVSAIHGQSPDIAMGVDSKGLEIKNRIYYLKDRKKNLFHLKYDNTIFGRLDKLGLQSNIFSSVIPYCSVHLKFHRLENCKEKYSIQGQQKRNKINSISKKRQEVEKKFALKNDEIEDFLQWTLKNRWGKQINNLSFALVKGNPYYYSVHILSLIHI